jgi:CRP-like cAMP-binding protein
MKTLSTGELHVERGHSPEAIGFVVSGLLKLFYLTRKGREYIRNFCPPATFAASYVSLLQGSRQSDVSIVALEPSELVVFDYQHLRERMAAHWTWQQLGRVAIEQAYLAREQRQLELLTLSAEERLDRLFERAPLIAERCSQKDVATYIGITPVSLSRLRANRRG